MRALSASLTRRAGFLLATTAAVTACGDGGSGDTGAASASPPSSAAPGALTTTTGVGASLSVVAGEVPLPVVRPLDFTRVAQPGKPAVRARHASLAAVIACESSGTRDATQSTRSVDSPYTDTAMLVTRTVYARCVDFTGPPDDPHRIVRELHGAEEFGETHTAQGAVLYVAVGDPQSQLPLERRERATIGGVVREEETLALGRADALLDASFDVDARLDLSRTFVISTDGRTVATGSYRLGSAAETFRVESHGSRTEFLLHGGFQFQSGRCDPGPAHVATTRALLYDPIHNRFVGGLLTFTSAHGSATAEFNSDGTVTLMDTQGRTTTIDWQARIGPWEGNACFEP